MAVVQGGTSAVVASQAGERTHPYRSFARTLHRLERLPRAPCAPIVVVTMAPWVPVVGVPIVEVVIRSLVRQPVAQVTFAPTVEAVAEGLARSSVLMGHVPNGVVSSDMASPVGRAPVVCWPISAAVLPALAAG